MHSKALAKMVVLFLCLIVFTNHVVATDAGDNIWTSSGPYGARVYDVAVDPENNQVLYAALPESLRTIYKSSDGGQSWAPSDDGIDEFAHAFEFAFDPVDSRIVYVTSSRGIYKTYDSGQTWELLGTIDIDGTDEFIRALSIAISPLDGTIYVGAESNAGMNPGGLYRSRNGGADWERLTNGVPPDDTIPAIAVAPGAPHIVYAAGGGYSNGIFRSIDSGDSWERIDGSFAIPPYVWDIVIDPYDNQVVYLATTGDGIYKTTNGGQSWFPIGGGLGTATIHAIAIDSGNQQVMYVGGGSDQGTPGVYKATDNSGSSWQLMSNGLGSRTVFSLAIDENVPQNIYAGTSSGVWKYTIVGGPEDYSVTINEGALFTNQTDVTLTLIAPNGTTEMMISNDGGFGGAFWEPFTTQKPWTMTSVGSYILPRTVYAKFRTDGQISGLYQDDIVLDVTPPTGSVVVVNNAADTNTMLHLDSLQPTADTQNHALFLPLALSNARPGFNLVTLALSATDDLSGVGEVLIGNDAGFTDSQWETYSRMKHWWVPDSPGTRTVYVQYRDRAGNTSDVYLAVVMGAE